MTVRFDLGSLPYAKQSRISFTQTFALTTWKVQVIVAALTRDDRPGIARQRVCPVTGTQLGSHGTPVKVLIDGRPVYLCCKGCLGRVKKTPEVYLHQVSPALAAAGQITVATATAADQAAIRRQRLCAVTNSPLGSMGTPVKVTISGEDVFLCCKGCLGKVRESPELYRHRAAELRAGRSTGE
jgi:YHS domain-containing protein